MWEKFSQLPFFIPVISEPTFLYVVLFPVSFIGNLQGHTVEKSLILKTGQPATPLTLPINLSEPQFSALPTSQNSCKHKFSSVSVKRL